MQALADKGIGFCMNPSKTVLSKEIGDDFVATSGIKL
jgi:hypothetical protein